MQILCIVAAFCLSSGKAFGQVFSSDHFDSRNTVFHGYVSPNEHNIQEAEKILAKAPSGAYLSVGTERGLIGAGFVEDPTHIILIDVDLGVVNYNRYNVALLKLARDRRDYLFLRERISFEELQERLKLSEENDLLLPHEAALVGSKPSYDLWQSYMTSRYMRYLNEFDVRGRARFLPFGENIYLRNDTVFGKVKALADQNKIESHVINFDSQSAISELVSGLDENGVFVSVLDVSNAWWEQYVDIEAFRFMVQEFAKVTSDKSLLFMSDNGISTAIRASDTRSFFWNYFALTFDVARAIHTSDSLTRIYRRLRKLPFAGRGINRPWLFINSLCNYALK